MPGPGFYLFGDEEKKEIMDVLEKGYLFRYGNEDDPNFTHKVATFEKEFTKYIGVKNSLAVTSGTAALMTCLAALGIGPGDEVIIPGYTFIASISAIIYSRAIPVLAEIDESLTIDPLDIEKRITEKTKAIMPVHMLGNPCNMDEILKIAKKHNLYVIEDACQAAGASYKGKKVGSFGNINAFSLNFFKTINTGDGGVVTTDDDELYRSAFGFHDQGHNPYRFGVEVGRRSIIGQNFRMNELSGAIALAQLRKMDRIISMLKEKKKKLKDSIKGIKGIGFRKINDDGECGTLLTLLFDKSDKAEKFCKIIGSKTLYNSGWHVYSNMENILGKKMLTEINCPFTCPYYGKDVDYRQGMLPKTDDILKRAVNISIGVVDVGLGAGFGINILSSEREIEEVSNKIKKAMEEI